MAAAKAEKKQDKHQDRFELTDSLEQVFLAGLGAMSAAGEAGAKTFESLVRQGEDFRKKATAKTGKIISEVQDAVRGVADDATGKADGLFEQVRESSQVARITSVFDQRVARALKRLRVPTAAEVEELGDKIDHLIGLVEAQGKKPAAKKKTKKAAGKKAG